MAVIVGLESFLVRAGIIRQVDGQLGLATNISIDEVMGSALAWAGPLAPILSVFLVVLGATAVFGQFVGSITDIWNEPHRRGPIYQLARHNLFAFLLLVLTAVLLFVVVSAGSVLQRAAGLLERVATQVGVPVPDLASALTSRPLVVYFVAFVMFTIAYEMVPVKRPRWRDAALGAALTAVAFTVGDMAMSTWLGATGRFAIFGSFQSLVAVVVYAYYSTYISLIGAEFTHKLMLAKQRGQLLDIEAMASRVHPLGASEQREPAPRHDSAEER
jgi:membrane protein